MAQSMEQFLAEKKEQVLMAEAVQRLFKNKDFKTIIAEGFLEKEAIRCVAVKAQFSMQDEEHQKLLDKRIIGIGEMAVYLQTISALGNFAKDEIKQAEKLPPLEEGQEYELDETEIGE